ncbi:MAG: type II toxin-antitoxin system VapB family antitoxin [Nitrospirae bacterium]|nr:type II toxin-antitoxin system VapB family antitoxin [Nitrospirota bacterium]
MRTNIAIDDKLIKKAFQYSDAKTKKGLINEALKKFVEDHSRMDLRRLKGKVRFMEDYDYKALRKGN